MKTAPRHAQTTKMAVTMLLIATPAAPAYAQFASGSSLSGQMSWQAQSQPSRMPSAARAPAPWGTQQAPSAGGLQTLWVRANGVVQPSQSSALSGSGTDASRLGPSCQGTLPASPQQQVWVAEQTASLRIAVRANAGTLLALRSPSGEFFCTQSSSSGVASFDLRALRPGAYLVYVGAAGAPAPYTLTVDPAVAAVGPGAPSVTAPAEAPAVASPWGSPSAPLAVPSQPAASAPAATAAPAPGVPVGWVRVGNSTGGGSAAEPAPALGAARAVGTVGGALALVRGGVPLVNSRGEVTGQVPLRRMGRRCAGYSSRQRSARFSVGEGVGFVRVWARAVGDSTIAIRMPDGVVVCADDTFGIHPGADFPAPIAGDYDVYVGTIAPRATLAYDLYVSQSQEIRPEDVTDARAAGAGQ